MADWEIVIGLETHAQLSTESKMFSGASTAFGAAPNAQASAVDIALPGVLPVANLGAVERALRFGLAVGASINRRSVFARKNYFYPDLPKGYQISQYELPIVQGGSLSILTAAGEKSVRLTRAHLEEDAGKSLHEGLGQAFSGMSGIDLNRAGTPLLEIVSEPDMRSAEEAVAYARALHALVRWIGICDGNMAEGSFRCDANVSVRRKGSDTLGTRREIKNLNSFRFLAQAIEYEARWQIERIEEGGRIEQATVLFDAAVGRTRAMRTKEDAHDYRYFPDPDLPPLEVASDLLAAAERYLADVGTPRARQLAYALEYAGDGVTAYDASVLTQSRETASYFDEAVEKLGGEPKLVANWVTGELAGALNRDNLEIGQSPVRAGELASLLKRVLDGTINAKQAKDVFRQIWENGKSPLEARAGVNAAARGDPTNVDAIIEGKGLKQITDTLELEAIVAQVLAANPKSVEEYRSGKGKAFNALVGQVMKATRGKGNPAAINELLKKKLAS
jgi:aspartyl-tRNA(Asn)/glutamyl-tRNA(Gln) amidotransferase subunit B